MKCPALTLVRLFFYSLVLAVTASAGTVTDIDGNVYETVTIGTQVWMAQNLRVTHYRNGDSIPNFTEAATWAALTSDGYCNYNNDNDSLALVMYGRLYNWHAATDPRNIAPVGWHVPTDDEWRTLVAFLGGTTVAGGKLKESGTTHWLTPNTGATNSSGFTALPGGSRYGDGHFGNIGNDANYWSSTEFDEERGWGRGLSNYSAAIYLYYDVKVLGLAIRCVKDTGCCIGKRGNVNGAGIVDLADLSALVGYLLTGSYVLPCPEAANINGVGIVDLSDLSALVSYLLIGSYVLPNCP